MLLSAAACRLLCCCLPTALLSLSSLLLTDAILFSFCNSILAWPAGSKVLAASRSARWVCFLRFSPPCQLLLGFRVYRGLELQSHCLLPCLGLSGEVDAKQKLRIVVRCRPCLLAASQGISNSETFDPEPKTAPQPEAS